MSLEATLDHFIKEQEMGFRELREMFKETDKRFRETGERFKETDERFKKTDEEINKSLAKSKELEKLFIGQWGKLIEALFRPSVVKLFRERKINIKEKYQRVDRVLKDGSETEFDILLVNDEIIVAIEVKTTLRIVDVDEHIEKRLKRLFEYLPRFKGCKIYGGIAYVNVQEKANKYAYRKGLFVVTLSGENMVIITNDQKFKPKDFGE